MIWSEVEAVRAVRGHWLGYAYVLNDPERSVNSIAQTEAEAVAKCRVYIERREAR